MSNAGIGEMLHHPDCQQREGPTTWVAIGDWAICIARASLNEHMVKARYRGQEYVKLSNQRLSSEAVIIDIVSRESLGRRLRGASVYVPKEIMDELEKTLQGKGLVT